MDSSMERWGVGVRWEEEKTSKFLAQDFIDGGLAGFIQDMDDLLDMPREVAVELWTQADEGFVGNNDRLDKKAAAMALTMVVYRKNRQHYEDRDLWWDTGEDWNELPKNKYFAAVSSDLQKRIDDWNRVNVDSKEAKAKKSEAKKSALWKWNETDEERWDAHQDSLNSIDEYFVREVEPKFELDMERARKKGGKLGRELKPVSYTHLTLPTKDSV